MSVVPVLAVVCSHIGACESVFEGSILKKTCQSIGIFQGVKGVYD
jgi:hypothetical protein